MGGEFFYAGAHQASGLSVGAQEVVEEDAVRVTRLVDDAVLERRGAGEDEELSLPGVVRFELDHQVLFWHRQAVGQVGVGKKTRRQGQDAGAFGGSTDDFHLEAFGVRFLRVDFERAGGDEIESAAGRHREALHIIKSRQDPEVERRDDCARFAFTEVE